ncbi:MAG: molybdenum cofactor guanylyltransferase [Clostridium perfringens]|nr:molybdenum cofactor guanylyltransferase [Clostridium perfringens]
MEIEKSAVILSGGKNSRMGYETKAFLKLKDKKFIDIIIEALKDYSDIIVSCNNLEDYEYLKPRATLIEDEIKDIGPMGGIYSCLKKCKYNKCLFVASDMPFINKSLIDVLTNESFEEDALVPIVNGKIEPLVAVYDKKVIHIIEELIDNDNFKIRNLLKLINVKYINITDDKPFINVNTKEEYENIKKEEE